MTANARIITAEREDALQVPLQALRFSPGSADQDRDLAQHADAEKASLWVLDGNRLRRVQVERGIDDGASVEIVSGNLKPGDRVVIDEAGAADKAHTAHPAMGFRHF
jgi:HlyD family secretion protein